MLQLDKNLLLKPDASKRYHGAECKPPHERRHHLEVLGLGHVEEAERSDNQDEDGESNSETYDYTVEAALSLIMLSFGYWYQTDPSP